MEFNEIVERAQAALDKATRKRVVTLSASKISDEIFAMLCYPEFFPNLPEGISSDIPVLLINSDSFFDLSAESSLDAFVSRVIERVLVHYGIVRPSDG